jgi:hypothetical protein
MYKRNVNAKEMKGNLIPKGSQPGKVPANPKIQSGDFLNLEYS